jgi:hypothetical protein
MNTNRKRNGLESYKYKEEQKITEFGLASISEAALNFFSSSALPIARAAAAICRINSCNRLKTRIRDPSNWSVA